MVAARTAPRVPLMTAVRRQSAGQRRLRMSRMSPPPLLPTGLLITDQPTDCNITVPAGTECHTINVRKSVHVSMHA
jgi:hypothetical protein